MIINCAKEANKKKKYKLRRKPAQIRGQGKPQRGYNIYTKPEDERREPCRQHDKSSPGREWSPDKSPKLRKVLK